MRLGWKNLWSPPRTLSIVVLVALALGAIGVSDARARTVSLYGERRGDSFASDCAIGDVDGDGTADVVVNAPRYDSGPKGSDRGRVYVYSAVSGRLGIWNGGGGGDELGTDVALVDDLDGDGAMEVLVGAPGYDVGISEANQGRVYVYSGASGDELRSFAGETRDNQMSLAIAAGDVDGDGFVDIATSTTHGGQFSPGGKVYLYSGADWRLARSWSGENPGDDFGAALSAGDMDADGTPDLMVGAPSFESPTGDELGRVYVFSGATGALLRSWTGPTDTGTFGRSLLFLGDVDDDGFGDLGVASIEEANDHGRAFVYSGATGRLLWRRTGEQFGDRLGRMFGIGDLDGDDRLDFTLTADGYGDGLGRVYALSGATGKLLRTWEGSVPYEDFGWAVCGGDVDGDGHGDIAIGSPRAECPSGEPCGRLDVHFGGP